MTTMKEVAAFAGVSVATVSRAINHNGYVKAATKMKIEQAIEALNYAPNEVARTLNMKQSKVLGLLLPDMSNPFFTQVARGVEDTAMAHGYHIMIGNGAMNGQKEMDYLMTFKSNHCSGVIASQLASVEAFEALQSYEGPHVLIDRTTVEAYCVEANHQQGGRLQAEAVLRGAGRRVLIVYQDQHYQSFQQRYQVAKQVLKEAGCMIYEMPDLNMTREVLLTLIHDGAVDSVICGQDASAFRVLKWLHDERIRVPEEVQVVGYDDVPMAPWVVPGLTTVNQPTYQLGEQAVLKLIAQIEGHAEVPLKTVLDVTLIERESTRRNEDGANLCRW
ncbi:LacI family DNA-binding transcriptional regulator [Staphylococcus lutrae]|uniref:LacI family transcriptional regulator n=1 Tax=Staphylococcus lutrae TaxID=155085 RepID=A0AAC9RTA1_9STAP|nr:LacI family DNA-binding transcriptional regulator [Staphylococcus lutrae]ARJ50739.1 LacI family transcriptional regulator [Staphylococcus lutrae]PNZ37870.1 LacI family transcriptional regulator [Staphylococcus lutrae]